MTITTSLKHFSAYLAHLRALLAWLLLAVLACADYAGAAENRDIRAGIFGFEGYHTRDENGSLKGYGIDLLRLLSEYSHLDFNLVGFDQSWQKMQEMLLNGEIDLVSSARRTPEREQIFAFSFPVGRNHTTLSRKANNPKIKAGKYSTYNGMKIGLISGSSQNNLLEKFASQKGFTYIPVEFDSARELEEALQNGEVDAILTSSLRKPKNETVLNIVQSDNFYVIARKEDQALIDEINYAIEQMNMNEGDWQNELYYRNYGPEKLTRPELSDREQEFARAVRNNEKRVVATASPDNPPYSYIEKGQLRGILPEYFQKLMDFAKIPYTLAPVQSAVEGSGADEEEIIDVVLDRPLPDEYLENATPGGFTSAPYFKTGLAMVTRRGESAPYERVAVPTSFPLHLDPEILKNSRLSYYATPREAMQAVEDNEADAAYVLPYNAQLHINQNPASKLASAIIDNGEARFHIFVPPAADHELITILNKAIKAVPPGTINNLGAKHVSFNAKKMSLSHYLYANPVIMLSGAIAIMLSLSLISILWLRGKWNRRILKAAESANQELEGQLAIVEALSRDYSTVLAINPVKSTAGLVKITEFEPGESGKNARKEDRYGRVLERYIYEKVLPDDREALSRDLALPTVLEKLEQENAYGGTFRILQDGEIHHIQFTFVRPHGHGELVLAGFRNIDDVICKEQEQQRILSEALEKSNYANIAKTKFLNNMSHDIRTPMNAILGFTNLAATHLENKSLVRRYLEKIQTSGNHLLNLINDVLDMSRIESGKIKLEETEVSIPDLLLELFTIVQGDMKSRNLDFRIEAENIKNEIIYGDRLRINQVLLNILSNAMKYTPAGGKVLLRVRQGAAPGKGMAEYKFHIRDTGIGMGSEFLKHVFEPFEREQTATVSGIQGTGLGLSITRHIVETMAGSIEVESEPGKGSEFVVSFRFRVQEPRAAGQAKSALEGARALVIARDQASDLVRFLERYGILTDSADSAGSGIKMAKASRGKNYAICFLEAEGSESEIAAAVVELKKHLSNGAAIILVGGYGALDNEEDLRKAGISDFLHLPLFQSRLAQVLEAAQNAEQVEEQGSDAEEFGGKKILLAEDNEMNQEIAQMILEAAGFSVDIVENGKLAVEKIQDNPAGSYDLILMDVQMPVMNGYDATREIRKLADAEKAGIPIIALTANAFEEDREEVMNAGMTGYVSKPIDIPALMEALKSALKNPGKNNQARAE